MKNFKSILIFSTMLLFSCTGSKDKIQVAESGPEVERWDYFEASFKGPDEGNPFKEVDLKARFRHENKEMIVSGFYDGNGTYKVRFMPAETGKWEYSTISEIPALKNKTGHFTCVAPSKNNHGPVEVFNTFRFRYADGTPYYQIGTTCYAWVHQGDSLEKVTLETLKKSAFNKLRMCIFPKDYVYNENEPVYHPFPRDSLGYHDFSRFNPEFWHHLEKRLLQFRDLGIEADIILFHPYDRWGYAGMSDFQDNFYLKYAIARLSAFRNVWWSMANEFDFMQTKTMDDWHRFFQIVFEYDPYKHLRSIHNGIIFYNHELAWVTHASLQSTHFDSAMTWRKRYKKPLVYDECRYEGDVTQGWGNMSPEEMTAMFWRSLVTGTYAGHGETYEHPEDILWWSKGGELHGKSPERISFFRQYLQEVPEEGFSMFDKYSAGKFGERYFYYFDQETPAFWTFELPADRKYRVEIIDTWNMTSEKPDTLFPARFTINLPQKKYIAVKIDAAKFIFPIGTVELMAGGLNYFEGNNSIYFHGEVSAELFHTMSDEIRYSFGNQELTKESVKYNDAINISKNTDLHAAAFEDDRKGQEMTYHFISTSLHPALNPENFNPGLKYSYFEGEWKQMPDFSKMTPIREGTAEYIHLNMNHREDYFGLVFEGYIKVPYDGVYTFFVVSDDGAFILVDGEKIVDNDGQHGMREARGQIGLKKGFHSFEVPYFDNWYDHGLEVYYYHEKTGRKPVSKDMLFH